MTDDLVKRLRAQIGDGHAKGCDGRSYNCDCGFDLATEGLLDLAASALESLTAENAAVKASLAAQKDAGYCDAQWLSNGPPYRCGWQSRAEQAEQQVATLLQQRNEAFERAARGLATSIARRNEDAPEIHELSAMLSGELTEGDRR